jgi:LPXTG-site transpeptidase (sortase) family protein
VLGALLVTQTSGSPLLPAALAQSLDPNPEVPTSPPAAADADVPTEDASPADLPPEEPVATGPWGVPPVKLMIPGLGIEAVVEAVGEDPDGAMSVPTDPDDVAWYQLGPGMGVPGNVVLAGHVNWDGRVRTFGHLHELQPGDAVQVIDAQGRGFEYLVESSRWVRAEGAPLEEIFAQEGKPMLTLITCGGEYVASRREYLDRLIVHAKGH